MAHDESGRDESVEQPETEASPGADEKKDEVDKQSEESFPASDPPSY
jgi:hypothetical protein